MKYHLPHPFHYRPLAASLLAIALLSSSASALVMRDNGPEPVIIQIKDSLRESDQFDSELETLASSERDASVTVEKRWVGAKYLELVSFPKDFSEADALNAIRTLAESPAVQKIVPVSAANLEFRMGDFDREYDPTEEIPDAARRGFDAERAARGPSPAIPDQVAAPHVSNRLIVGWKAEYVWNGANTGFDAAVAAFHAARGCTVVREFRFGPNQLIQVLEFGGGPRASRTTVAQMLSLYAAHQWADFVQPDYRYSLYSPGTTTPNDPKYPEQWSLPQIKAPYAWHLPSGGTQGTQGLKVAVGDTGANINHPDFAPNLAPGWFNFINNNTDVTDQVGHGSNVASIIGAKGNNGQYMCGVDWNVSLLHLKVIDNNNGSSSTIAAGINYAWQQGALAINLSLGSTFVSNMLDPTMFAAIRNARANNMVVVAAAGNQGVDSDNGNNLVSPACIPVDNVLSVGATDQSDNRAIFQAPYASNYGQYRVELGAPGLGIWGLSPVLGGYTFISGTSQAAPHVAGALQLVKSKYSWESYAGLKDRVLMAVDNVPALNGVFRTGGRLNLENALKKRNMIRNLSTRARVESGDRRMIGGFVIGGAGMLKVAIRGLGPTIPVTGVTKLNNPQIRLFSGSTEIFFNDDWNNLPQDQKNDLSSVGLTPGHPNEAAMVRILPAGAYTVIVESQDGQFGVGLFEIYELGSPGFPDNEQIRLLNVSTRCIVGTGNEVAIAGTILGDPSIIPNRRMLSFGRGPSLAPLGLAGVLPNPYLELFNSNGQIVVANDQWKDIDGTSTGLQDKLVEAGFRPQPSAPQYLTESNVWPTLRPGAYTAVLRDAGGASGIGIVEFYEY